MVTLLPKHEADFFDNRSLQGVRMQLFVDDTFKVCTALWRDERVTWRKEAGGLGVERRKEWASPSGDDDGQ